MSKMKKRKQKTVNIAGHSVLPAFNIPLPDELRLPMMVDVTGLHAIKAEMNHLKAQEQLRNAASPFQKPEVVPSSSELNAFANIATNA
jgi:hypothetical protein